MWWVLCRLTRVFSFQYLAKFCSDHKHDNYYYGMPSCFVAQPCHKDITSAKLMITYEMKVRQEAILNHGCHSCEESTLTCAYDSNHINEKISSVHKANSNIIQLLSMAHNHGIKTPLYLQWMIILWGIYCLLSTTLPNLFYSNAQS